MNNDYLNGIITGALGIGLGVYGYHEHDSAYYFGTVLFSIASLCAFFDAVKIKSLEERLK